MYQINPKRRSNLLTLADSALSHHACVLKLRSWPLAGSSSSLCLTLRTRKQQQQQNMLAAAVSVMCGMYHESSTAQIADSSEQHGAYC
jgi:hypothetical protein